ncbi:Cacna1c [Symbiodinium natans]|uniref:Cacna1c protein n=1 Tax=Symbiodinium natans TaxID=878477 RepID=A0A812NM07_9DINO|nr:Cacna1c [Symbiodinium natans]
MEDLQEAPELKDRSSFERHLDSSWKDFRQKLLDAYVASQSLQLSTELGVDQTAEAPSDATGQPSPEEIPAAADGSEVPAKQRRFSEIEELTLTCPFLKSGLQGLSPKEMESVRNRLRLRLGILNSKQLVSGRILRDAVQALGLTIYGEEDMNEFVNLLADFISLQFRLVQKAKGSQSSLSSLNSLFSFGETASADVAKLGKPTWHWPAADKAGAGYERKERKGDIEYDCVPALPLLEIFLSQESEVHKHIFGYKLNQYRAIREILLAGDTNRLVAELTFVRINDLATPPEPMHPIMYLEPFVALIIFANGVMIGFQTDPQYKDWPGWIYVEMIFAMLMLAEICFRLCVLRCAAYWCGADRWWNMIDVFLAATSVSDIALQLAGFASDLEGTSLLRFCRLIRLIRIVKLFRVKAMRELRLMVKGLLAGIRTLSLAFVLLFAVLYVIAGFATMTIGNLERTAEIGLGDYFFNIPTSMFTAFRCFTGECISDDGRPLQSLLAAEYGIIFVAGYVASYMLVAMGIFNVILAVYVDITMKAAKENDAVSAEQHARESIRVARTTRELLKIFSAAYHSFRDNTADDQVMKYPSAATFAEDGMHDQVAITKELFLLVIQDRKVQQLMDDLDLPPDRANLFEMLDADGSGTLQTTELLQGLLKIRGEVNKSDTVASLLATKAVQNLVSDVKDQNSRLLETLRKSSSQLAALRSEVVAMSRDGGRKPRDLSSDRNRVASPSPADGISSKLLNVQAPGRPGSPCQTEDAPPF